jgi:hypothetical protein
MPYFTRFCAKYKARNTTQACGNEWETKFLSNLCMHDYKTATFQHPQKTIIKAR